MSEENGAVPGSIEPDVKSVGPKKKLAFNYCKSPQYRTIHSDGIYGGPSPLGKTLVIGFYSERNSFPDTVYAPIEGDQLKASDESDRVNARPGIMREIEANVVMDLETAIALRRWLDEKIKVMQSMKGGGSLSIDKAALVDRP